MSIDTILEIDSNDEIDYDDFIYYILFNLMYFLFFIIYK